MLIINTMYKYHECIAPAYTCNICMCISELQMALHPRIGVEDLLELYCHWRILNESFLDSLTMMER